MIDTENVAAKLPPVRCFATSKAWIEGGAREQLEGLARLPGVSAVAGLPDLHPGKYGAVGCAVLSSAVHPARAGADIGCGMGLFALDAPVRKLKVEAAAERLAVLEGPWDGDTDQWLADRGVAATEFDRSLGTIGGGNHFCELQAIEEIVAPDVAAAAGLDAGHVHMLVHSGSRGRGRQILEGVLADGLAVFAAGSGEAAGYLAAHDGAVAWAVANRALIAARAAEALGADVQPLIDLPHNLIEPAASGGFIHRKGAAPADRGLVPVPGSRGTLSYLVEPLDSADPAALASLAHGAGRKYDRGQMHGRIRTGKADRAALARNPFGGRIVCTDKDLLVEEAPDAYKSIERVIGDLVELGLARVVASFRPLVTFKKARGQPGSGERGRRQGERRPDRRRGGR